MYLKRVTITGFKSFASKTVIEFERGISAVVGPNGSGKSNVADAIRWCLGEQSKSKLRTSERDEVIFAGSEGRARASLCEVALVLDNDSGRFGLDVAEVELARRLYRSGESEYRLAGKVVTLREAQALMAEAGFGAGTYAVIGQGMIDSLLLASPSERKLLFDEAAGIRGPELRRDAALRQLASAGENVARLRAIAAELEPRLRELERAVAAGERAATLRRELDRARGEYAARAHHELARDRDMIAGQRRTLDARLHELRHARQRVEARLAARLESARKQAARRAADLDELTGLEARRDALSLKLAAIASAAAAAVGAASERARLKDRLDDAKRQREAAHARSQALQRKLARNGEASARAATAVQAAATAVAAAQFDLVELRDSLSDEVVLQYVDHALRLVKTMAVSLDDGSDVAALRLLVHKAGRLLSHASRSGAAEVAARIGAAQTSLERAMTRRDTAIEHQTNITISARSLELDLRQEDAEAARYERQISELTAAVEAGETDGRPDGTGDRDEVEAAFRETTDRLVILRERLSGLPDDAGQAAELAAELERTLSQTSEALRSLDGLDERSAQLAALERTLVGRLADWGIEPADAPERLSTESLAEFERRLIRSEAELEAYDRKHSVDASEYESVRERHEVMSAQISDLESAEQALGDVVIELDVLIRERFRDNFARLSDEFGRCYGELFDGGTARLELSEGGDRDYGVDIRINPKGRRFIGLSALSGGERAMAGVALLNAILLTTPAPFVVLDEVDAALDDANSGRLAASLARLSEHSQLIVITHNRQTMATARILYGVTMDARHTSKVLSLRLEDAAEMAAR